MHSLSNKYNVRKKLPLMLKEKKKYHQTVRIFSLKKKVSTHHEYVTLKPQIHSFSEKNGTFREMCILFRSIRDHIHINENTGQRSTTKKNVS